MLREDVSRLATELLDAQERGGLIDPPSIRESLRLEEAYDVGAEIAGRRLRAGWRFAGWKVGFTNPGIWSRYGLDRPIVAPVYRETVYQAARGAGPDSEVRVPFGTRAALRIEVEVVFGFVGAPDPEMPDWVALGVEIVDCHYEGWRLHPADAVADFGLHAGLVIGPPVPLEGSRRRGIFESLAAMAVSLNAGGVPLATGEGSAVLGSPAHVLRELNGSLKGHVDRYGMDPASGSAGEAGWVVSTGTLTPLVEARVGDGYRVESDQLPSFSFRFS